MFAAQVNWTKSLLIQFNSNELYYSESSNHEMDKVPNFPPLPPQVLSLEKQVPSDQPSSVQVRKSGAPQPTPVPSVRQSTSDSPLPPPTPPPQPTPPPRLDASTFTLQQRDGEPYSATPLRSVSNLSISMCGSQKHLPHKESTPSLASDVSLPFATLELQQRLRQLQK